MANAKHDHNGIPTFLGTLQADGKTPIPIRVNPSNHAIKVSDGTTGTASSIVNARHDDNGRKAWMGVSNIDFKTRVLAAADANGNLLIKST